MKNSSPDRVKPPLGTRRAYATGDVKLRGTLVGVALLLVCTGLLGASPADAATTTIKMATLVPQGSVWDRILREMGNRWQEDTNGQVRLTIYAGGVAGDEPDVVRKMRIGQLHAAAISTAGLVSIDPGFQVFQIPMFFASYEELFHVLETLRPDFEARLEAKGYVLLNWGNGGWVHLFSKLPVRELDDLKSQKLFSWAGDESMIQMWRENGFQPIALAATDIHTGLQTGLIEAVPTTPLAALSLQWFRETPYMQNLGLAPLVGATVISHRMWNRLTPEVRSALRAAARETEARLFAEIPEQDSEAVEQMSGRGLTVVEVDDQQETAWRAAAEDFAAVQRKQMAADAKDLLDRVQKIRDTYRAKHSGE
ncbi:MAG: TRAP transporter substrate-binding protein DctP [Thermoanaerobaculia bacterium]|nr:TRAP transporter substrate-binding protein DctP [Thermoanaerobaculia bacterium]